MMFPRIEYFVLGYQKCMLEAAAWLNTNFKHLSGIRRIRISREVLKNLSFNIYKLVRKLICWTTVRLILSQGRILLLSQRIYSTSYVEL